MNTADLNTRSKGRVSLGTLSSFTVYKSFDS